MTERFANPIVSLPPDVFRKREPVHLRSAITGKIGPPVTIRQPLPDDETFWAYVRLEFELTPEFTNLVSVVRGHFTKVNREIAFNEATRLNLRSAPGSELSAGNSKEGRPELVARIEFLEWTEFPLA